MLTPWYATLGFSTARKLYETMSHLRMLIFLELAVPLTRVSCFFNRKMDELGIKKRSERKQYKAFNAGSSAIVAIG